MAKPIITQPKTPRVIAQGVAIPALTLVATNSPLTWTASPLPAGLSLDEGAGTISGTPTAAGLVQTNITATNGEGTSEAVQMVWSVQASPPGAGGWDDIEVDFDLISRQVSLPGVTTEPGAALLPMGRGDMVSLLVGFVKHGVLQDLNPNSEDVSVKYALKEIEPELVLTQVGGAAVKVGAADMTRYRITAWIDPARWGVLDDYESARKTSLLAVSEIEVAVGTSAALYDEEVEVTGLSIETGMSESYGIGSGPIKETLVFLGLTATEGASYELTVAILVADRPGQSVTLMRTLTLTFTGGVWVVSEEAGQESVQGAAEAGMYRLTLTHDETTGDADSVDVDVTISTTPDGAAAYQWEFSHFLEGGDSWDLETHMEDPVSAGAYRYIGFYDSDGLLIGSVEQVGNSFNSGADFLMSLSSAWYNQLGYYPSGGVNPGSPGTMVVFEHAGSTAVHTIRWGDTADMLSGVQVAAREAAANAGTLTGRLRQLAGEGDRLPRRTSLPFATEVIRDSIADA